MDPLRKKSNKLSFKGDKPKKKKKSSEKSHTNTANEESLDGWTFVEELDDLVGPIVFTFPADSPVAFQTNEMHIMKPKAISEAGDTVNTFEPSTVQQVLTGQRVIDSEKFTFKTCYTKYLSADKFGALSANREAIGPQEEWTPVIRPDGVCFQSVYDKFLTFDEVSQKLTATEEFIGFGQTFKVKCQKRIRYERLQAGKKRTDEVVVTSKLEDEVGTKYMSFQGKRKKLAVDLDELKRAKEDGKLNETLLDRRQKVKSDKFCM